MIAFASFCQTTDTIHVNRQQFVRMLTKAEQAKSFEAQRDLLLTQVDTLKARIVIKEMIIVNLNSQISDYRNIIQSHENIIATMKEQRNIFEGQITILNKQIKKQRRAKRFTAFIGLLTTGLATYLFISK